MMGRVVCIGECMVELSAAGDGLYRQGFAGDTFNAAFYLRQCLPDDWDVDYLTAVGTDALSERMLGFMAQSGIGTQHVRRNPDATVGMYMINLHQGERSFTYWRGQSAARHLADDPTHLAQAVVGAEAVVLSGITLAILSPEARERLLTAISGGLVVFDPNMRPRLWPDADTMRSAITLAARQADIVLPSFDEEQAVFGDPDPQATIARYRDLGAQVVVVKNGPHRIWGWDGQMHSFDPEPKTPVDTTAAGDGFNAGFLAAHLTGADLTTAMAAGAAVSAQVIGHPGALVPLR
ncbi:MAG: sugar kinase [Paracoccaceae bacterium]